MKILIPYFPIQGTSSYPDDVKYFVEPLSLVTFEDTQYYVTDYIGNMNLESDVTYEQYESSIDSKFSTINESISIGSNSPLPRISMYPSVFGDNILISADVINSKGELQTQLDQVGLNLPPVLFLPFTKYAGGVNGTILDEIPFDAALVGGKFSIEGVFPSKGNWIMTQDRVNQALKSIGVDWEINCGNVSFMVK